MGEMPYRDMKMPQVFAGVASGTLRPKPLPDAPPNWVAIMEDCWTVDAAQRPSFSQVSTLPTQVHCFGLAMCSAEYMHVTDARNMSCNQAQLICASLNAAMQVAARLASLLSALKQAAADCAPQPQLPQHYRVLHT